VIIIGFRLKKKHLQKALDLFFIYIIIIYALIYKLYDQDSSQANFNKIILFMLILFVILFFVKKKINVKSKKLVYSFYLIWGLYLLISLMIYYVISDMVISDVFKEILYSILPITLYFIAKSLSFHQGRQVIKIIFISIIIVMLVGMFAYTSIELPLGITDILTTKTYRNFSSYYSPIVMGYFVQLLYAMVLFDFIRLKKTKLPFLVAMFILALLTYQRAAYLGVGISTAIFFLHPTYKSFSKIIFLLSAIFVLYFIFNTNLSTQTGYDIKPFIFDELENFTLAEVTAEREEQNILFNDDNIFNIIFGDGYGKYSPNNQHTIHKMPDASYLRIFNELGLIGLLLFLIPFSFEMIDALRKRQVFYSYFILFTLIAFYFNRILWSIPLAYIIYFLLGTRRIENNRNEESYETHIDIL